MMSSSLLGILLPAAALAVGCFHLAWSVPGLEWLIPGFLFGVAWLTALPTPRATFYSALGVGLACYGPHLGFFYTIFGLPAVVLWGLVAVWTALFALILRSLERHWGTWAAALAFPWVWMGLEYFRAEVWSLRFSWLAIGYTFSEQPQWFSGTGLGVYGVGAAVAALVAVAWAARGAWRWIRLGGAWVVAAALPSLLPLTPPAAPGPDSPRWVAAGVQLEYPFEPELLGHLDRLVERYPEASLVVLSEYTLLEPPGPALRNWCRRQQRCLVVGGKDPLPGDQFYNTAFVIDPDGEIVFRQVKSVPIQFFQDGQPAPNQALWSSPWGRLGFAICYDLSYRRVMDRLVALGAQALIVPTVDDTSWGARQHTLHARVARVRAAEYGLPIFRVASSGISQFIDPAGQETAAAPFPGQGASLRAEIRASDSGRVPLDRTIAPVACGGTFLLILALGLRHLQGAAARLRPRLESIAHRRTQRWALIADRVCLSLLRFLA